MRVYAKLRYLRIAPRKVRLVADLLRGKTVEEAQNTLHFTAKRAAPPLLKLLKSAIANAKNNFRLEEKELYISKVLVDEGPKLKRWIARARGKADEIQKKTSHITIVLDEVVKEPKEIKEGAEMEKTEKVKKIAKIEKQKLRPEMEILKPKKEIGKKKIFRRMAF